MDYHLEDLIWHFGLCHFVFGAKVGREVVAGDDLQENLRTMVYTDYQSGLDGIVSIENDRLTLTCCTIAWLARYINN